MKDGEEEYADYNMCGGDGNPAAGICHARGVNHDLPPVWMLYLPVGDVEESLKAVVDYGGRVLKTIKKVDGDYVYAVIQDPVGVCFAIAPG